MCNEYDKTDQVNTERPPALNTRAGGPRRRLGRNGKGADATWYGNTDANWATAGNWSAAVPGSGNTATFNNAGGGNTMITVGAISLSQVLFATASAAAYTLGSASDTITFADGTTTAIQRNSSVTANEIINANITLGTAIASTTTIRNDGTTGLLTLGGTITGGTGGTAAAKTLTIAGSGNTTLGGVISKGGATSLALSKSGAGTLTLAGANSFTGTVTVGSTSDLNSGTILLQRANQAAGVQIYTGTLKIDATAGGSVPSTFGVTFGASGIKNMGGGAFIYNFAAGGGSVNLGALSVIGDNGGGNFGDDTVQVTRTTGLATLTFSSNAGNHFGPTLNFLADADPSNTKIVLAGQVAGWLYKNASHASYGMRYYFNGADFAWYDGSGYVRAINYNTPDTSAGTSAGGAGSITMNLHQELTGNLTSQASATINTLKLTGTASITMASSKTLTINNLGGILKSGSGISTISGGSGITTGTDTSFRIDDPDGVLVYEGVLSSGVNLRFNKSGAGTMRFTGASNIFRHSNDYINGGILEIAGTGTVNVGASGYNIAIATGALFKWNSTMSQTMNNLIYGGGGVTVSAGTLNLVNTSSTFSGQLTVEGGTLAVGTINNVSANGVLGNSTKAVILGKSGGGMGTLQFTGTSATYSSTKPFTMATGGSGTFQIDSSITTLTLSGAISGAGGLAKSGAGTLEFSTTAKTYTGDTTISDGTLKLSVASTLDDSSSLKIVTGAGKNPKVELAGGTETVNAFYIDGKQQAKGTWSASGSSYLTGTGVLDVKTGPLRGTMITIF